MGLVVYLRGRNVEKMRMTMERVHEEIGWYCANVIEGGFTVSVGSRDSQNGRNCDFERLIKVADEKFYRVKNRGKNRLVF